MTVDNNDRSRRTARRLKYRVLRHYSGGDPICSCCGESHPEFLAIDHIDGGGRQHRKSIGVGGKRFYAYLVSEGFPTGY